MSYKALEEAGIMMPVLENHSYYHHPAVYDDLLSIEVSLPKLPGVKICFRYKITNEAGTLVHSGETILAFIKADTKRPCRPPQQMTELLKPFYSD
jgi:acyl-CoA thioester hydrolase